MAVAADIPKERPARWTAKAEGLDEEKKLHEEFQDKTGKLRDKLAKESQLAAAQRVYVVDSHILGPLIRDRAQILEKKTILSEQNAVTNKVPLTLTR